MRVSNRVRNFLALFLSALILVSPLPSLSFSVQNLKPEVRQTFPNTLIAFCSDYEIENKFVVGYMYWRPILTRDKSMQCVYHWLEDPTVKKVGKHSLTTFPAGSVQAYRLTEEGLPESLIFTMKTGYAGQLPGEFLAVINPANSD